MSTPAYHERVTTGRYRRAREPDSVVDMKYGQQPFDALFSRERIQLGPFDGTFVGYLL
jgi:hypothetical protein